jgi:hypothetical protein
LLAVWWRFARRRHAALDMGGRVARRWLALLVCGGALPGAGGRR